MYNNNTFSMTHPFGLAKERSSTEHLKFTVEIWMSDEKAPLKSWRKWEWNRHFLTLTSSISRVDWRDKNVSQTDEKVKRKTTYDNREARRSCLHSRASCHISNWTGYSGVRPRRQTGPARCTSRLHRRLINKKLGLAIGPARISIG